MQNSITLTPAAQQYLQENLAESPEGTLGVRIGLRDAGCSGYAYTIDFADTELPEDHILNFDSVKIFIAKEHVKPLQGTAIDLVNEGVNTTLEFDNPNVVHECGCGESFKFKDDV